MLHRNKGIWLGKQSWTACSVDLIASFRSVFTQSLFGDALDPFEQVHLEAKAEALAHFSVPVVTTRDLASVPIRCSMASLWCR